jgi:arsenate reductase
MTPSFISHELYLLYNPATELGRKTHALALSLNNVVHEINVMKKSITRFRWEEIINLLQLGPSGLLDTTHPDYALIISGKDFSENDFLEVLCHNPQLVKGPIGILHNKAVLCDDPKDILKLDTTPAAEKKAYQF